MNKSDLKSKALELHEHVPANWYYDSIKKDFFQRIWHKSRFREIERISMPASEVLDVGCADGMFTNVILLATRAKKIIGLDVVKTSVEWARKHWKKNNKMKFVVGDAHDLKFPSNSFDAVYCLEALEHVVDPKKVLLEFKRVLRKGGFGVFLVPSDNNLFKIIWWLWLHFYPRGWVWRDTHIQTYRGNYLPAVCRKVGFKVEIDKKFNLGMLHLVRVRKV